MKIVASINTVSPRPLDTQDVQSLVHKQSQTGTHGRIVITPKTRRGLLWPFRPELLISVAIASTDTAYVTQVTQTAAPNRSRNSSDYLRTSATNTFAPCASNTGKSQQSQAPADPMYVYWVWKGEAFMDPDGAGYWVVGDHQGDLDGALCVKSEGLHPMDIGEKWFVWSGDKWVPCLDSFVVKEALLPESKEKQREAVKAALEHHKDLQASKATA